jgi:hypothetical protein
MKTYSNKFYVFVTLINLFLISCTDTQPENDVIYFSYVNKTNENVELKLYDKNSVNFKNVNISPNSTYQVSLNQNKGKGVGIPFLFDEGFAEKVVIKFEASNKCLVNYYKIKESKFYDNYLDTMLNRYGNYLDYIIDQEELDLATTCL